jgi:energy-converting hydrogenase Eha subunit A
MRTDAPRSASVIYAVMWGYMSGWLVATIVLAVIVKRLNDPSRPQSHPIRVAVAAGSVWPLVILGATQMAAIALVVDAMRCRKRRGRPAGEQYDESQEQRRLPAEDPPSAQMPCSHGGATVTR